MHHIAALSSLEPHWIEVTGRPRVVRPWNVYSAVFRSFPVVKPDIGLLVRGDHATVIARTVGATTSVSPNICGLNELSAKIASGELPKMTPELAEAADAALAVQDADADSISDWAKKLAASVFKH